MPFCKIRVYSRSFAVAFLRSPLRSLPLCGFLLSVLIAHVAAASEPGSRRYLITENGAVGDCKTLNTKAIQKAIDRCSADGGGTLVVPEGTFITGSIFLKPGVNLIVEKGGVLKGSSLSLIHI